jgi:hypothetical protein
VSHIRDIWSTTQTLRFLWDLKAGENQPEEKRDFSLRRPTFSQERKGKKKSACSVRNDVQEGSEGEEEISHSRNTIRDAKSAIRSK